MPKRIPDLKDWALGVERRREMPPFRPDEVQDVVLTTADEIDIIEPSVPTIVAT